MLVWDHKYELGHARIDAEHRIFLGLITDFQQAAAAGAGADKQWRILKEIVKYAEFHFLSEENIMEEYDYPDRAQHCQRHRLLLAEFEARCFEFRTGDLSAEAIFDLLFQWFALHTSTEDRKLVGFLH